MSREAIAAALARTDLSSGERLVAFSLASFADRENLAWPGTPAAAARAGMERSGYLEARDRLVRRGLLIVEVSRQTPRSAHLPRRRRSPRSRAPAKTRRTPPESAHRSTARASTTPRSASNPRDSLLGTERCGSSPPTCSPRRAPLGARSPAWLAPFVDLRATCGRRQPSLGDVVWKLLRAHCVCKWPDRTWLWARSGPFEGWNGLEGATELLAARHPVAFIGAYRRSLTSKRR
jgi:hypothetical protein